MARPVKREPGVGAPEEDRGGGGAGGQGGGDTGEEVAERRAIRSRYLAVKSLIVDERDDILKADSERFRSIITEVEALHQQVRKPSEQLADAEALLDIANSLVACVRSYDNDGVTPSLFISAILQNFGQQEGTSTEGARNHVRWRDVGQAVSPLFKKVTGCCTMMGPMDTKLKQRKTPVRRKRTRPTESTSPEVLQNTEKEDRKDTAKNMSTMFDILRRNRSVRLENLVLNRISFAQTVENIFALSFLVKDGRAEITVDDDGHHLVSPRNAPAASIVASGEVSYSHFVFRFDFKDWELMIKIVGAGDELMPHRKGFSASGSSEVESHSEVSQSVASTPIMKLTRNRGLIVQEQSIMGEPRENDSSGSKVPFTNEG